MSLDITKYIIGGFAMFVIFVLAPQAWVDNVTRRDKIGWVMLVVGLGLAAIWWLPSLTWEQIGGWLTGFVPLVIIIIAAIVIWVSRRPRVVYRARVRVEHVSNPETAEE